MKNLITIFLLMFSLSAGATDYYISNSGNNSNSGTSSGAPWQTISKVNSSSFSPGDIIYFERGGTFNDARLNVPSSGSSGNPITFGAYGSGAKPKFTYSGNSISILTSNRSYLIFDNLMFIDGGISASDHATDARIDYAIYVGSNSHHVTVQNCDFDRVGVGVSISEESGTIGSNTIQYNNFYNLRMVVNTPGGDDDYGCNGIVLGSPNNLITHNSFTNLWGDSFDYGVDAAAIECFTGSCDNTVISYNYADSCAGWTEQGSSTGGTQSNLSWYYNLIINCGQINYVNGTGGFAVAVANNVWYNNVIVQTETPLAAGTPGFFKLFNGSGTFATGAFIYKNNIFKVTTSAIQKVYNNVTGSTFGSNIYQLSGGCVVGRSLSANELSTSSTLWTTTTGNAATWDYHLSASSPAIDFGQDVGLSEDYEGTSISGTIEAGIYQFGSTPAAPPVITSSGSASARVGIAFSYQITATNSPTIYGATNLPAGISYNPGTGLVDGTPTTAGVTSSQVSATNADGTGYKTVQITVSTNTVTPTIRKRKRNRWWF